MTIYLDHNATTPLRPEVWETMASVECEAVEQRANPSSVHRLGLATRRHVYGAREIVAGALGASPEEIIFTGGGSEAINLAIKGAVWGCGRGNCHLISTQTEHHAVLHALEWLGSIGHGVTLCPVDVTGRVSPEAVAEAITPETLLVSVMLVNNEVGTIQPVAEIGAICRARGLLLHVDAVQGVGKLPVDVNELNCDLLSLSAHKIQGPQGVGALYVRQGTCLTSLVHGGPQEGKLRAGTENVAGIVGLGEALRLAELEREANLAHWRELREILYRLPQELDAVRINSHPDLTLPNCINASFMYCDGMALTMNLSMRGICVSTSSACTAGDLKPSHVLKAMGLSDMAAHGALRISMGRQTTPEEVTTAVETIKGIVSDLRLVTQPDDIGKCKDDCPCFVTGAKATA